jgi:hypothetical protein
VCEIESGCLLARDLILIHRQMCDDFGWMPRPWNPIGHELARITTGGRKIYAWIDGHRLRVYPVRETAAAKPSPMSRVA